MGWGLHLQSGLAASRSGRRSLADEHLCEARATAERLGDDCDRVLSFGPTNVGIWSVALAVEAMDGTEALNRAHALVLSADTPKERAGHHYIDLSRAYLLHGDRRRAFDALLTAKLIAPAQTRYNPMVHETARALARAEARAVDSVQHAMTRMEPTGCRITRYRARIGSAFFQPLTVATVFAMVAGSAVGAYGVNRSREPQSRDQSCSR